MNLFILNPVTFEVDISPEVTLLKFANKIIDRDKTKDKKKAKAELAFIYFMTDYKSDFQSILDENDRAKEIISVIEGLPDGWKEDKIVREARIFYKERSKTIASVALEYQRANIFTLLEKIGTFMESDDANEVQKAATMSAKVNSFIKDIDELEKIVKGQQEVSSNRHRGSQDKSMMEDDD